VYVAWCSGSERILRVDCDIGSKIIVSEGEG